MFRDFDQNDWQAFAGCESASPKIAEYGRHVVIVDGCTVQAFAIDDNDVCGEPWHHQKYATEQEAMDVAVQLLTDVTDEKVYGQE